MAQQHLQECIRRACLLEATARKPGNVHPGASFDDLSYQDLRRSAEAVAPVLARSRQIGVGQAVLEAVRPTRQVVATNTNLGMLLLLAPLAAVEPDRPLSAGIEPVLNNLNREDASLVYQAIRLAEPGGLGTVDENDVRQEPTGTLLEVMQQAAERDRIAAQYAHRFDLVLKTGVPLLKACGDLPRNWEQAVLKLQLELMAGWPDTLIARRCGWPEAEEASRKARQVLEAGWPRTAEAREKLDRLDAWLRAKGNRRNPGTTADLVAASLFAALRDKAIIMPQWESLHSS